MVDRAQVIHIITWRGYAYTPMCGAVLAGKPPVAIIAPWGDKRWCEDCFSRRHGLPQGTGPHLCDANG